MTTFKGLTLLSIAGFSLGLVYFSMPTTVVNPGVESTELRSNPAQNASLTAPSSAPYSANNHLNLPSNLPPNLDRELPDSLRDVFIKPVLLTDEQGNLIVTSDLKNLFDAFLTLNNLESTEQITQQIRDYLTQSLNQPALDQSLAILEGYINFKHALYEELKAGQLGDLSLGQPGVSIQTLSEHLNAQRALRAQHLSAEVVDVFFSAQDDLDNFTLNRLTIAADQSLSAEEKLQALAVLEANTPDHIMDSRKQADPISELRTAEAHLKQQGASAEAIHEFRVNEIGVDAAARYAQLDTERAQWAQRLADYNQAKQAILDEAGLSEDEQQTQLQALIESRFDARERLRVEAQARRAAMLSAANTQ